jgi:hypothetical protein
MDNGDQDGLDPAVAERVRRDLADLGSDGSSASDVPPGVTARVIAALRAEPAHTVRRPLRRLHVFVLVTGVAAALAGAIVGALMLGRDPSSAFPVGPTAKQLTVARPESTLPLPDPQIIGLLSQTPDYGQLSDPQRRDGCLAGLGYPPGTAALGGQPLDMHSKPAVLMLLPGDTPEAVVAVVVEPGCNAARTGLLARDTVTRP